LVDGESVVVEEGEARMERKKGRGRERKGK